MEEKGKGGRPTEYKEEYNKLVYKLCLLGAIDREIAEIIGVSEQTLNAWKQIYPQFLESIKNGKVIADSEVANSLFKRARGYQFKEKTYEDGALRKEVLKDIAPDTGAAMAWLKNRQSAKWRDKQEIEIIDDKANLLKAARERVLNGKRED